MRYVIGIGIIIIITFLYSILKVASDSDDLMLGDRQYEKD